MREVADRRLNSVTNFVCAGTAAAAARYPVNALSMAKIYAETGTPGGKMGISQTFKWIWKLHGIEGYGRTAVLSSSRLFVHYGIQFGLYERLMKVRPPGNVIESVITSFAAGAIVGPVATLFTHPLDVIKVRRVIQPSLLSESLTGLRPFYTGGVLDTAVQIVNSEGIYRGIYRGLGVSMIGSAVFSSILFGSWDFCSQFTAWRKADRKIYPFVLAEWFTLPLLCYATAMVASHPWDVIRRKYMAQSTVLPRGGMIDIKFTHLWSCVREIFRYNHVYGFYQGIFPNILKTFPQLLTFWIVFKGTQGTFLTLKGEMKHPLKNFYEFSIY